MRTLMMLAALALPAVGQSFDFSLLDKLGTNAKNKSEINLDPNMLKLASGVIGKDAEGAQIKNLVSGLRGVTIRSFEFDGPGKYNEADLEPFRAYLKQQKWSRIVDSQDDKEHSEIYALSEPGSKIGGLAIIAAEARELTVVYINGSLNMDDLNKLGGTMGIPNIRLNHSTPTPPPAKSKKEE